jgi:hypothetical protein
MLLLPSLMLVTGASSVHAQATEPAKYFAIYYTVTSSQTSKVYAGDQIFYLKEGSGLTMCYIPALNITTCVAGSEYTSPDWAPGETFPYTVDNRLFLIDRDLPESMAPGQESTSFTELNPANCTSQTSTSGYRYSPVFNCYSPTSFEVVNDNLYFQSMWWVDMFSSKHRGMELSVVNLTSGSEKQLLTANDPDNYGTLISAGGNLFRYVFNNENLTINQIDLDTGKIARGIQLLMPASPQPSTNESFRDWFFSADENTFYIAAARSPGPDTNYTQIWLCTIPLTEFENNSIPNGPDSATGPDYWFNVNQVVLPVNASFRLWGTDACAGVVLLKIANAFIILYDSNTGTYITIPGAKDNACILYGATNPEPIPSPSSSSSPSPPPPPPSNETLVGIAVGVTVIALVAVAALFVRRRKGAVSRFPPPPPPPPPPA